MKGTFLSQNIIAEMEKVGNGRILLISSIAGKEGKPGNGWLFNNESRGDRVGLKELQRNLLILIL